MENTDQTSSDEERSGSWDRERVARILVAIALRIAQREDEDEPIATDRY